MAGVVLAPTMSTEPLQIATKAEHLTDALRRSGALGDGRVCNVVVESSRSTLLSNIIRLRLTYDGTASHAPTSVILKTGHPERIGGLWNVGRQEVAFYTQVAAVMSARLVPRCFEAVYDTDTKEWHLLLEDLTDSHMIATTWPLPPTMEQCEAIMAARARLHAEWWDDPPPRRFRRRLARRQCHGSGAEAIRGTVRALHRSRRRQAATRAARPLRTAA